ncbi:hypothetical protein [Sphingomonas sp. PAMC 26621]|uniref:hypothetical protein n=1 Tax=Sphingomonas sp. PAMC 26621 TaxID=1112213 RepID=UPI0011110DAE|nr:hypothetical protein [Sphingomonas sp. PAMC 26621]
MVEGVKDAFGGHYDRKVEDTLLWHNAQAFAAIGSIAISYGLTERLAKSPNEAVRSDAINLASVLMAAGFKPSVKLKNPWVLKPSAISLKLGALSVVPAILTLTFFIYNKDIHSSSSLPITSSSAPLYSALPTEVVPPSLGTTKDTSVAMVPKPAQLCKRMPQNGKILIGASRLRRKGHTLTIDNGSGGGAIVNVRNALSGKLFASMFIGKNDQAVMLGIPDGRFRIQYALGGDLAKSCKSFVELSAAGEFPDQEQLQTITESNYLETIIKRMHISYTLYTVPAGNVQPLSINENEFDAP